MNQSENLNQNPKLTAAKKTVKYWEKMGRLNLWAGIMAHQQTKWEALQHRKNREAEESHTRKTLWGSQGSAGGEDDEDMGDTYLGDVTINPQPSKTKGLAMAAGLALASAIPTAAWLYSQAKQTPDTPAQSDDAGSFESLSIGLGRIEDYQ